MKTTVYFLAAFLFFLSFASCIKSKDPVPDSQTNNTGNPGNGGGGTSGSGTGGGTATSTITYVNASFTGVNITINGVAKTIAVGGNV